MERVRWTDARLDERMGSMERTFELIRTELAGLREEMNGVRAEVAGTGREVAALRSDFTTLRSDFSTLQDRLIQIAFALVIAFVTALLVTLGAIAVALLT